MDNESPSEDDFQRLDQFGMVLAAHRAECISWREQSGIESEWTEDQEFCEGIDDANRGEMSAWRTKPPGRADASDKAATGSTVFVNITRPYCDAFAAMAGDILQPVDDSNWGFENTPVPELIPLSKGMVPPDIQQAIAQRFPDPQAAEAEQQRIVKQAADELAQAQEKAEKAQKRVEDWHAECQYHSEVRLVIKDVAEIGSGVLKGPYPVKRKQIAYIDGELVINEEIKPASKRIDPWNLYPDGGCGESIHNGSGIWERDDVTGKEIEALKGLPGYIAEQIDLCLQEGAHKATAVMHDRYDSPLSGLAQRETKNLYEIWYYHGRVSKADMEAAGCVCEQEYVDAQITMVNNRVIKAILNPIDTGEFPYDVVILQKRVGMPWGAGIARKIRTPQRILNGAWRAMMDNAGIAARPQIIFQQGIITPASGPAELRGGKVWIAAQEADTASVDKAFRFVTAPMLVNELMAIITAALKMAEDVTGLPMLMQGQMGQKAPDTLGGMQILNNNATTGLRAFAHQFDDMLTEPHLRRYFAYLLQYGPADDEKGEFVVNAKGSSVLVERAAQAQQMVQIGQMAQNPVYGIDPQKYAEELLKSLRIDPERIKFDDEKWKEIVERLSQPQQQDNSLAVAQLRADVDQIKIGSNERIAQAKMEFEADQNERDREIELMLKGMEAELDSLSTAGQKDINLDSLKARLAEAALKMKTTKELAGMKATADKLPAPAVEPPGRAPAGQSYQQ